MKRKEMRKQLITDQYAAGASSTICFEPAYLPPRRRPYRPRQIAGTRRPSQSHEMQGRCSVSALRELR